MNNSNKRNLSLGNYGFAADVKTIKKKMKKNPVILENMGISPSSRSKYTNPDKYKVPLRIVLEFANQLGTTVDGIILGNCAKRANPYNIDVAFENIFEALQNAPKWWHINPRRKKTDGTKTLSNYKKKGIPYIHKNIDIEFFLELCLCWGKSAEDILEGKFPKKNNTTKSK